MNVSLFVLYIYTISRSSYQQYVAKKLNPFSRPRYFFLNCSASFARLLYRKAVGGTVPAVVSWKLRPDCTGRGFRSTSISPSINWSGWIHPPTCKIKQMTIIEMFRNLCLLILTENILVFFGCFRPLNSRIVCSAFNSLEAATRCRWLSSHATCALLMSVTSDSSMVSFTWWRATNWLRTIFGCTHAWTNLFEFTFNNFKYCS